MEGRRGWSQRAKSQEPRAKSQEPRGIPRCARDDGVSWELGEEVGHGGRRMRKKKRGDPPVAVTRGAGLLAEKAGGVTLRALRASPSKLRANPSKLRARSRPYRSKKSARYRGAERRLGNPRRARGKPRRMWETHDAHWGNPRRWHESQRYTGRRPSRAQGKPPPLQERAARLRRLWLGRWCCRGRFLRGRLGGAGNWSRRWLEW